jgi:hypothetical protein
MLWGIRWRGGLGALGLGALEVEGQVVLRGRVRCGWHARGGVGFC